MTKADFGNARAKEKKEEVSKPEKTMEMKDMEPSSKKRIRQITFVITLCTAGFVCYLSAERYFSWMAQTVIDRTDVHVSEIPFPAVTLCPIVDVYALAGGFNEQDKPKVLEFLHLLEEINKRTSNEPGEFDFQGRLGLEILKDEDVRNKVDFKCEDFFVECTWRRIKRDCCSIFRKMVYGATTCFSFNSLMVDDPDPTWPWTETLSGPQSGLRVVMNANASQYMLPKVFTMIHYPEEQFSTSGVHLHGEVEISLDASLFHADPELKQLRPDYRRCYFTDEVIKYGKAPCQCLENCRRAFMEQVCNCTPYSIAKHVEKKKQYCNITHLPCVLKHRDGFFSSGNIYEKDENEDITIFLDCKCYPNCNYVQYKTFIRYYTDNGCSNSENENATLVNIGIHFLRDTIFSYRSAMVYNFLDLFVALCSIIALFLGVSFIGVIKAIQDHFHERKKARALGKSQQIK